MENKEFTCIVCPIGCNLRVSLDNGKIVGITGNTCKRGYAYAESETLSPTRTVTSTMRLAGGGVVAVKTSQPIPKAKMMDVMHALNSVVVDSPIKIGDVLIANVLGLGADIVATQSALDEK